MSDPFWSDGWFWGAAGFALAAVLGIRQITCDRKSDKAVIADKAESLAEELGQIPDPAPANFPVICSPGIHSDRRVVGRDDDVDTLRSALVRGRAVAITPGMVIRGQGGMGKTTLARHYVETHRTRYYGIWWLNAATRTALIGDLCALGSRLGLADAGGGPEAQAKAVAAQIQASNDDWLLIYDNAERLGDLRDLRPVAPNIHVLITTREGGWPANQFTEIPAGALTPDAATDLLMQEAERTDDRDGAAALAETLGHLPLALVTAGAWLRDAPGESFADYAARWEERLTHKPDTLEDYPDSVFGAVSLSIERLSENAALLLKIFAYLAPTGLRPDLVTALAEKDPADEYLSAVPPELWSLAREEGLIGQAFADLTRRSLIESDEDGSYALHRLTQAVQRALLTPAPVTGLAEDAAGLQAREGAVDEDQPLDFSHVAAAMIAAGYPQESNFPPNFEICEALNDHIAALDARTGGAPATPAMQYLYNQAGIYFSAHRMDRPALRYAIATLRLVKRRGLPNTHREFGVGYNNLAAQFKNLGRVLWAEQAAGRAADIAENNAQIPDADRALWFALHGRMLTERARRAGADTVEPLFERARQRLHQALSMHRRIHGRHSREVGSGLSNLASWHDARNRPGAVLVLYRTALSVIEHALDRADPDLASGLHNLGFTLLLRGDLAGARPLLRRALAILIETFTANPRHVYILNTARWLGAAALLADDPDEAQAILSAHSDLTMAEFETIAQTMKQGWPT